MTSSSPRARLRAATTGWHDRVDAVFSRADVTDARGYAEFLRAQAAAYLPVEHALTTHGAEALLPGWSAHRRADALRADARDMGVALPELAFDGAGFAESGALLGGIYVLEGSRLGGTLIARSVPEAFPTAFLSAATPLRWRALMQIIDARLEAPEEMARAIDAAEGVFEAFERSGMLYLGKMAVGARQ